MWSIIKKPPTETDSATVMGLAKETLKEFKVAIKYSRDIGHNE